MAAYAVETMLADGLIGNGPDGTIGNFDLDRVDGLIEIAVPVYEALGQTPPDGLTAEDVVTNQFIDPSIGLPADDMATDDTTATTEAGDTTAATSGDTTETTAGG